MNYPKGTKANGGNAHITTCYDNDGTTFDAENTGGNTHTTTCLDNSQMTK